VKSSLDSDEDDDSNVDLNTTIYRLAPWPTI